MGTNTLPDAGESVERRLDDPTVLLRLAGQTYQDARSRGAPSRQR